MEEGGYKEMKVRPLELGGGARHIGRIGFQQFNSNGVQNIGFDRLLDKQNQVAVASLINEAQRNNCLSKAEKKNERKVEGKYRSRRIRKYTPLIRNAISRVQCAKEDRNFQMQKLGEFKLPQFLNYPPYFTLQPVRETREKQVQLWKDLILEYCRSQKIFIITLEEDFPLFTNPVIERSLRHEAREVFLSALVSEGRAEWMDKNHKKCLILWLRIQDWADLIVNFVRENGLEDSVMTIEDIRSGIESRGTELEGIDRGVLMRALKLLEQNGKAAIFKGATTDEEGVKFSA